MLALPEGRGPRAAGRSAARPRSPGRSRPAPGQVRPVPGPVAGHPGDADPAARAAHLHHRAAPAPGPGASLRGLSPWPASSSKQMKAPRSHAVLLYRATPGLSTPRPRRRRAPSPGGPGPGRTSRTGASASRCQPLPPLLFGGRVPATLRIPHIPVIRRQPPDIDPHAGAIPWPGPPVTSITQPVDLGPFEDASACLVMFARLHGIAAQASSTYSAHTFAGTNEVVIFRWAAVWRLRGE